MLVIIVGGIPIAMPTVLSVTLALGAFELAKEGAIVARMSAVEEMAGECLLLLPACANVHACLPFWPPSYACQQIDAESMLIQHSCRPPLFQCHQHISLRNCQLLSSCKDQSQH